MSDAPKFTQGLGVGFKQPEPRRVFCKDCRHLVPGGLSRLGYWRPVCAATKIFHPIHGEVVDGSPQALPTWRNKNLDCALFAPREPSAWRDPVLVLGGVGMVLCVAAGIACVALLVWVVLR